MSAVITERFHEAVCGSTWRKWDLHLHTPSSYDYENKGITDQRIVDELIIQGISVVAITDHHFIDIERVKNIKEIAGNKITILPGIELRSDQGGDPIHYIGIFPEDVKLDHVWTTLQGRLGLTRESIVEKGGDDRIYVPIEDGAKAIRELGGIVSIHAGSKSNSIESIRNGDQFQQRIKYDLTKNWVDIMEIGQIKDITIHRSLIFPAIRITKPLVICSDNHNIDAYYLKSPLWIKGDPNFRGLSMILHEPTGRVSFDETPSELERVSKNPTKYIMKLAFSHDDSLPQSQLWFRDQILEINPGLIAIVGNKGSGKSAFADVLGLLGSSKNTSSFAFLNKNRFCHPTRGYAQYFNASIQWVSGDTRERRLSAIVEGNEVELIKYLPQDFIENICNELSTPEESTFEKELKNVIFSHVPEELRLGQKTLDDLIRFRTSEKEKRVDSLLSQLREVNRDRARVDHEMNPVYLQELIQKKKQKEEELRIHDSLKPKEVVNPLSNPGIVDEQKTIFDEINRLKDIKTELESKLTESHETLRIQKYLLAVNEKVEEKINNFLKDYNRFQEELSSDLFELGIGIDEVIKLTYNFDSLSSIMKKITSSISKVEDDIDPMKLESVSYKLNEIESQIGLCETKLSEPNKRYQDYLKDESLWSEKRKIILGFSSEVESLTGINSKIAEIEQLPAKAEELRIEQSKVSIEIYKEIAGQAEIYRTYYKPVQNFIDSHELTKDKLKLEFRVEIISEGFSEGLLSNIALNRKGTFYGAEDANKKADNFAQLTKWSDEQSILDFLKIIDLALHQDQRDPSCPSVQIEDQLVGKKKVEDVYNFLYGLQYIKPHYILRWDGKDLSMLSPGERGTLLLVFYLLIDKGDIPLVIDQPEGNLDNHTVAKVLVDCLREARNRRQIFIVTHNPNLAVVCDADQIIHARMDKENGNCISYSSGALENPKICEHVTDVLEGTRWAFNFRGEKYKVGE